MIYDTILLYSLVGKLPSMSIEVSTSHTGNNTSCGVEIVGFVDCTSRQGFRPGRQPNSYI